MILSLFNQDKTKTMKPAPSNAFSPPPPTKFIFSEITQQCACKRHFTTFYGRDCGLNPQSFFFSFYFLLLPSLLFAQTFTNATLYTIPVNGDTLNIPISVSGLPTATSSSFGLVIICLDIRCTTVADLRVMLRAPNDSIVMLADQKGGDGGGYYGTCFEENATNGWIYQGTAPFIGSYYPEQSLNIYNKGLNPNGTWSLVVKDLFIFSDTGTVGYFSITFGNNPPPDPVFTGCSFQNPAGCKYPDGVSTDCDLLPEMTASAMDIMFHHSETASPGHLIFSNSTPNIGGGPLEIHGIDSCFCGTTPVSCLDTLCPDSTPVKQLVIQRIYHRNGNTMTYYDRQAGTMFYDRDHGHTHIDDWSSYTLRRSTPNPDATTWPIIGSATKTSYCLVNLSNCDFNYGFCVDSAGRVLHTVDIPNSNFGTVSGCGIDQGIYPGNLDTYDESENLPGITLPVGTCNGDYYIVSITDPDNHFLFQDHKFNWVAVPITLSFQTAGNFETGGFSFSVNGNDVSFLANAATADSCVWMWEDGSASSTTLTSTATHTFPGIGSYIVWLYAYNHCGPTVSADTVNILPVGLNEAIESVVSFNIQPNPTKDNVMLSYTLVNATDVRLEVFDAIGNRVKKMVYPVGYSSNGVNSNQHPGKYQVLFDAKADQLSQGIYIIRLSSGNKNFNKRLVLLE